MAPHPAHLLVVTSSARTDGSWSRRLAGEFEAAWRTSNPDGTVTHRDLAGAGALGHVDAGFAAASKLPPDVQTDEDRAALRASDVVVDEVEAATDLLLAVPMYNWGLPSAMKSWIDHVVRIDRTAGKGFLAGRRVVLLVVSSGVYASGERAHLDFVRPYLRHILAVLGADDVQEIDVERTLALDGHPFFAAQKDDAEAALAEARTRLAALAART